MNAQSSPTLPATAASTSAASAQPTICSDPPAVVAFRMKEYEDLRKEVSDRLKELWTLEKFALGGAAAIAAWLLTHVKEVGTNSIAWWIPFIFLALCVCRFGTGMYHLGFRASIYIMKVERRFLGKEGGWETRFRQQGPNETYAYFAVWIAALAAASYLPFATLPVPVAVP